ncbi:hypothetical protein CSPX01_06399 [Colletotrichum filicis]|nr:hypothetical protein CSPX01_06399 [Colletotrichum filicis]
MSTFPHNTRRTLTTSLAGNYSSFSNHPSQLEPTSDRTQTLGWSLLSSHIF